MSDDFKPSELNPDNLVYVLNRCHRSLMRAYESQRLICEEFLFVAKLAKTTEELVKLDLEKQKINNQRGERKC